MSGRNTQGHGRRIPAALQAIILTSNSGHTVQTAPEGNVAFAVFNTTNKPRHARDDKKQSRGMASVRKTAKIAAPKRTGQSPQAYLEELLKSRGYSTSAHSTLGSAYHNKPTELQLASYDGHILKMIIGRYSLDSDFRNTLATGLSPNACNQYGESLIHKVCRRGNDRLMNILVELGAELRIADNQGRTPLHAACWSARPCFSILETILRVDRRMFQLMDGDGALPLSFVRKEYFSAYIDFFDRVKDEVWPVRDLALQGVEQPPTLALLKRGVLSIPEPKHALTPELARMVASGNLSPKEAQLMQRFASEEAELLKDDDETTAEDNWCSDDEDEDEDDDEEGWEDYVQEE